MAEHTAIENQRAPDLGHVFPWGLQVNGVRDLLFVTGHGAVGPDWVTRHPDDVVAQTKDILEQMDGVIERAGWSLEQVVRTEMTLVDSVTDEQFRAVMDVIATHYAGLKVKPSAGTLRYTNRLAVPGMKVELEWLLAR